MAVLDILGFKSRNKSHTHEDLSKLLSAADSAVERCGVVGLSFGGPLAGLSLGDLFLTGKLQYADTVYLFTPTKRDGSLGSVTLSSLGLFHSAMLAGIALRGAIGKSLVHVERDRSRVTGAGLSDLVDLEHSQEWAGVSFSPSINFEIPGGLLDAKVVTEYDVPTKQGQQRHFVLNWPTTALTEAQIVASFKSPGVQLGAHELTMLDNTIAFLRNDRGGTTPA